MQRATSFRAGRMFPNPFRAGINGCRISRISSAYANPSRRSTPFRIAIASCSRRSAESALNYTRNSVSRSLAGEKRYSVATTSWPSLNLEAQEERRSPASVWLGLSMFSVGLPGLIPHGKRKRQSRSCAAHRAWVRRHYCSVPDCRRQPIECAHVRRGADGGAGIKPSDKWVISLCLLHHREQHQIGECHFEDKYDLDLIALAREFARRSPHWQKLTRM